MNRDVRLAIAVLLAPTVWFALLVLAYWASPPAHEPGRIWVLRGLHVGALVLVLVGLGLCIRELLATTGDADDTIVQRKRFLAIGGVAVALFMVVLVVGMAVPTFMLWTGAEP
jgi:hypothetical protein